jgi:phytoene synthase
LGSEEFLVNSPGAVSVSIAPTSSFDYQQSLLYCRDIIRQAKSTFPIAFQLLPPFKRRAMDALYAFMRVSDDLADEPGAIDAKRDRLKNWRVGLLASFDGKFTHPIHPALHETVSRFAIPPKLLLDALDGVESDLEWKNFATFADLYPYCYRVASVVGLACLRIWGFRSGILEADLERASKAAEAAGIAFQLTNILRDLKEDYECDRVYLPLDELTRFGISPHEWLGTACSSKFRELIHFQVSRAKYYYEMAGPLDRFLSTDGRSIFKVMMGMYLSLLGEIEKDVLGVFGRRIRIPRWRKGLILLSGLAVKWGWR